MTVTRQHPEAHPECQPDQAATLIALALVSARSDDFPLPIHEAQRLGQAVLDVLRRDEWGITRAHACTCDNAAEWHRACTERDETIATLERRLAAEKAKRIKLDRYDRAAEARYVRGNQDGTRDDTEWRRCILFLEREGHPDAARALTLLPAPDADDALRRWLAENGQILTAEAAADTP